MTGMMGRVVAGVIGLAVVVAGVLFLLITLWPGEKTYLTCTKTDTSGERFGLVYERHPAWQFWLDGTGKVWVVDESITPFDRAAETRQFLYFDGMYGGLNVGSLDKSALRVNVDFAASPQLIGICDPASFAARW